MGLNQRIQRRGTETIPEDWCLETLDDSCQPDSPICYGVLQVGSYVEGGVPVLAIKNLNSFRADDVHLVSRDIERNFERSRVKPKDVLVSVKGTIGRVGIVPDHFYGNISRDIARIRLREDVNPHYVFQLLQSDRVQRSFETASVGTTRKELSIAPLRLVRIPIPPTLAEQTAIAEALSDVDALIAALEQLIAKKRLIKQGAMQELLTGRRRLPGFAGDWAEVELGKIGKCIRGVSYNPNIDLFPYDTESTIRLLRANNIQESSIVFSDLQYVNVNRVSSDQIMRQNDVLICMANGSRRLVGKAAMYLADSEYDYSFGAFMGCFRSVEILVDPLFVFYLFETEKYRHHIDTLLAGSSINNLTPTNLEAFSIRVPQNRVEQAAIAEVLSDMDKELSCLEEQIENTRLIKQGMMQELLTGRIRLI